MLFYSTNNQQVISNFDEAVFQGPAPDGGLFMPETIPSLESSFFEKIESLSLTETALEILLPYTGIDRITLSNIINSAFNFEAPLSVIDNQFQFLELFHGPTLAFKDFGARFMAQTMNYLKPKDSVVNILVATSGDTGGAVASAFSGLPGFNVFILFPQGKVSPLQQKQLTTWDENIKAIEVKGTFDDCQKLVKMAFSDQELRSGKLFASANSINIARLLPQMVYYFEAFKQAKNKSKLTLIVPSGNFGNLTAGLFAKRMGLPIDRFIAATNINDAVPQFLKSGVFNPTVSRETFSNAMDVGNPSNFVRMLEMYRGPDDSSTWNNLKKDVSAQVIDDQNTIKNIKEVYEKHDYIMDPHTAVAYGAAKAGAGNNIIISTAHWSKFESTIKKAIGFLPPMPSALNELFKKKENFIPIQAEYAELHEVIKA